MKISLLKTRSSKGRAAEAIACQYLEKNGLQLIEKNFNSRFGEIDIIMQHSETLVFIEVRYRKNDLYGGAKASITPLKQKKIIKTALYYMQCKGREFNSRFDVIAITGEANDRISLNIKNNLVIEWIKNAF